MSDSSVVNDGLLLLLQAAEKLDRDAHKSYNHPDKWEARSASSRTSYEEGTSTSPPMYSCTAHRRGASSTRCTHNELEKSRRAHLRTCMEALKARLVFDSDVPRITMLTILRKAAATIHILRQKNEYLEACEVGEKQRCAQLLKRRQALRKKLDSKRNRHLKIQSWRERNRNYSECSALTTSSEDSELDLVSRQQSVNAYNTLSNCAALPPTQMCTTDQFSHFGSTAYSVQPFRKVPHSPGAVLSPPCGADAYDASSSDSGFEEVTVTCTDETTTARPTTEEVETPTCGGIYTLQGYNAY
uniref:Max-interacting protein 1 n=2 Tax=Schistocephalus solidus TaxID=70667 RepID=A0A0X3P5I7_SCHSO